ncbi:STAS domain-containing protein [Halobacillus litoralis]|uniref:STAS domain-containing protein n=1 Tax=Halobacillus litoralis TaxID=45668 RepID=A0A845FC40_9BACI|nr:MULTISPECIES: STAS domain-containing protein [Halobacillus]MEC3882332.1 STAS domain-containing protein [Halobacillus sp. HZG1]MYL71500.1 STAS domain-containing protein [Halobacillus litoralis]
METNQALHDFLLHKAKVLTEEWYNSLNQHDVSGVYASKDSETVKNLKAQNYEFHKYMRQLFILDRDEFFSQINGWIIEIGRDPNHLNTPTHEIIREFMRVREQYLDFLEEFILQHETPVSRDLENEWKRLLIEVFDEIMFKVSEEKSNQLNKKIDHQRTVINELSSPLIQLSNDRALLPLVGNIDTERATSIQENTLKNCTEENIDVLYIDLSGVYLVDTMVAQQIFQLIDSLQLIGVSSTVVGIRPEIAQTAVQLGVDFKNVTTTATLSQAMAGQSF